MSAPTSPRNPSDRIAIVGMSCRFPGAKGPDALWKLLSKGECALRPIDERWRETLIRPRKHELTPPVPRAGLLDSIRGFDAAFFGISPREATRMDPQQRILLELAWEAFEDAGTPPAGYAGQRVGVFVGFNTTDYWSVTMDSAHRPSVDAWTGLGGSPSILANRISYTFDLRGPSVALDSACSASLFALHLARQSLLRGESDAVLAGAVTLLIKPEVILGFSKATMLSPTGQSRPFGDGVNGYVRGEGAGLVLLKRLDDALRDGDPIHAVLRGSAVSQDGNSKGITVPTVAGQVQMLELAYADAGVDPRQVRYVEAHGTGTPVGDPIETRALGQVVGQGRPAEDPCVIGSIKSNIGHLEAAAGIAGLIKSILCLEHDQIVPSLGAQPPRAEIPFDELGLRVAHASERLSREGEEPIVGVSSFGFGGTNAHVVLERAPARELAARTRLDEDHPALIPLSARSEAATRALAGRLAAHLREHPELAQSDVAHTLAQHRATHAFRAAVAAESREDLIERLDAIETGAAAVREAGTTEEVAFVFTGVGSQWWGMGRELYREEPVFRAALQRIDHAFRQVCGWSLLEVVFEAPEDQVPSLVDRADVGHPAHFALQIALCELLASYGIRPSAVVGHSAGEVGAACASGVLSFEDALVVVYHRSRLMQEHAGEGRMLALDASLEEAEQLAARFPDEVWIGAHNAPRNVTLSGRTERLVEIAAELEAEGRFARLVPGDFPYHSPIFGPIEERLTTSLADITLRTPQVRLVSTVHGGFAEGKDFGAEYWWRNVRHTVQFEAASRTLLDAGVRRIVEVGAHPTLLRSLRDTAGDADIEILTVETLRRQKPERAAVLQAAGELWSAGHAVDLGAAGCARGAPVALPTYPWQHVDYWVETPDEASTAGVSHPVRGERVAADRPTWQAQLSESTPRWAVDHRINGEVLLPAVSWVEAWLAALAEESATLPVGLEAVAFQELRPLSSAPVALRIRRTGERLTLESAPAPDASEWLLHGSARRARQHMESAPIDLAEVRSDLGLVPFDYDRFQELGYEYSRSFRVIREAWASSDAVLVRLAPVPAELDDGDYVLHPALFDGAVHAALALYERIDGLYLPMGFDAVTLHRRHDPEREPELWAHVRLLAAPEGELRLDLDVVTADGQRILGARGARLRRAGRPRFLQRQRLTREVLRSVPARLDPEQVRPRPWRPSLEKLLTEALEPVGSGTAHGRLDELARAHVKETLRQIAGEAPDPVAAVEAALARGAIAARHGSFALRLAASAGHGVASSAELSRDLICTAPEWHLERSAVDRIGAALPALLRGEVDARELLLAPDTELGRLLATDSATSRPAQAALRHAVAAEVESFGAERRVRILDVGSHLGGADAWILHALDPDRTDYVTGDLSPEALRSVPDRWRERITTLELDLERDPREQGVEGGSFDIVVASWALHGTRDLRQTLQHCLELLRPSGLLLFAEPTRPRPWLDLVFGGLETWWRFDDRELRGASPLLDAGRWEALLKEEGFAPVRAQRRPEGGGVEVLAARSRREPQAGATLRVPSGERWLLVGDDPVVADLARTLGRGDREVVRVDGPSAIDAAQAPFDRIVCLAARPEDSPESGASALLALVKWLEGQTPEPQLTVVTRGAQAATTPPELAAAAAWGFARVVANEHPELDVRLIDLAASPDPADAAGVLAELYTTAGEVVEPEVVLRGGLRFVPRVVEAAPERLERPSPRPDAPSWQLLLERPGDPGSLTVRACDRPEPGTGELEIEVCAVGLTSGDATRALAPDAPALPPGRDCVGRVTRVGDSVGEFLPGDLVIALAPGALRAHVIARASLCAPLPDKLSPSVAATLPSALATAELALGMAARLERGESVLVHGADGEVGLAAVRIALARSAYVLASASSAEQRAALQALGAHVLDSAAADFSARVLEATDHEGVDVVLNAEGGDAVDETLALLAPLGRFVQLERNAVERDRSVPLGPLAHQGSVHVIDLDWMLAHRPELAGRALRTALRRASGAPLGLPFVELPVERSEEALRRLRHGELDGRVVVSSDGAWIRPVAPTPVRVPVHAEATYVITGGLGGLGLAAARWLAGRGARWLALVGRSGAITDEAKQGVADLRRIGVQVAVFRADVSSASDVDRVFAEIDAGMPPVKGVFHAAMVLADAPVRTTTEDSLLRVFAAKARGALELHRATEHRALDFFVMCSSISRVVGNPGQASYVAANELLAALAERRRASGLPATCIDWGVIHDVGYVSRNRELFDRLMSSGFGVLTAAEALATLGHTMDADAGVVGIAEYDWSEVDSGVGGSPRPRYAELRARSAAPGHEAGVASAALEALHAARSAGDREASAIELVRDHAGRILRRAGESLGADTPLVELGFDSLMEVELRASLQRDTHLETSSLRSMRGGTVRSVAKLLLERLGYGAQDAPEATASEATGGVPAAFQAWVEERHAALTATFEAGDPQAVQAALARTLEELDAHVGGLDAAQHDAHRAVFYPRLASFFLESALLRRAHDKPLGYPGDYELMNMMYLDTPEGTPVQAAVDAFALRSPAACSVRYRVEYFRQSIERLAQRKDSIRVVNIGCGPARESRSLFEHHPELATRLRLSLVDQDESALRDSGRALRAIADRPIGYFCRTVEALADPASDSREQFGDSDLVWSAGLFDYFNEQSFGRYLQALYDFARPGGELIVGNLSDRNPNRWMMEYATDWFLHHRSPADLERHARALDPAPAAVRIDQDPTGSHLFLVVVRPS